MAFSAHSGAELPPLGEHLVLEGETLGILAERYGLSVAEIAEANLIENVDLIAAGRTLVIPHRAPPIREQRFVLALTQVEAFYRGALFDDALAAARHPSFEAPRNTALAARLQLLLGKIQIAFGNVDLARSHFVAARRSDPSLQLNAVTSPKIAALFRDAQSLSGN